MTLIRKCTAAVTVLRAIALERALVSLGRYRLLSRGYKINLVRQASVAQRLAARVAREVRLSQVEDAGLARCFRPLVAPALVCVGEYKQRSWRIDHEGVRLKPFTVSCTEPSDHGAYWIRATGSSNPACDTISRKPPKHYPVQERVDEKTAYHRPR